MEANSFDQATAQFSQDFESGKFDGKTPNQSPSTDHAPNENQKLDQADNQPSLTELGKLEKFLLDGKEMTPKELKEAMLRQQDYTKKTQELSQDRKFYENLPYDLRKIADNPRLAEEFKRVYPEKYHHYVDLVVQQANTQAAIEPQKQVEPQRQAIDPQLVQRIEQIENQWKEQEIKTVEAKLDNLFNQLKPKYDLADEEQVLARAQAAHNQGVKLDDSTWEKIFKSVNDENKSRYEAYYKQQVSKQKEVTSKSRDVAAGGGVPGQAPIKRTFDEATEALVNKMTGR